MRWIKKLGQIHRQAERKIHHADCLSSVPAVDDPSQVEEKIQVLVEEPTQNSCSDGFGNKTKELRRTKTAQTITKSS